VNGGNGNTSELYLIARHDAVSTASWLPAFELLPDASPPWDPCERLRSTPPVGDACVRCEEPSAAQPPLLAVASLPPPPLLRLPTDSASVLLRPAPRAGSGF
jgi:hypothetical protein